MRYSTLRNLWTGFWRRNWEREAVKNIRLHQTAFTKRARPLDVHLHCMSLSRDELTDHLLQEVEESIMRHFQRVSEGWISTPPGKMETWFSWRKDKNRDMWMESCLSSAGSGLRKSSPASFACRESPLLLLLDSSKTLNVQVYSPTMASDNTEVQKFESTLIVKFTPMVVNASVPNLKARESERYIVSYGTDKRVDRMNEKAEHTLCRQYLVSEKSDGLELCRM